MRNPTFVVELQKRLGAPSSETVESLRLLKAFLKLAPVQRFEVIELVERLSDPSPGSDPTLSWDISCPEEFTPRHLVTGRIGGGWTCRNGADRAAFQRLGLVERAGGQHECWIIENIASDLKVETLPGKAGMSLRTFARANIFGHTISSAPIRRRALSRSVGSG
jgi:hypothetical protein